ncbi:hypothetical protein IKP85_07825 [bacterium]|nr:hypothetical protein [bacterium]
MGFVTDSIRIRQLSGQVMDLKFKIQQITTTKMSLTGINSDLTKVGTDYDPESPVMKTLQQRQEKIKLLEEKLTMQQHAYQLQLEMAEAELASCKERLKSEIKEEFSYRL